MFIVSSSEKVIRFGKLFDFKFEKVSRFGKLKSGAKIQKFPNTITIFFQEKSLGDYI